MRHSKRSEMYRAMRARNTTSANTALRVISSPQLALTAATLTSEGSTPAASAKASCTRTRTSSGWSSTCTLMMSPLSERRSWIFA